MGSATSTTNPADFANRQQTYFSRELLKALTFNLRLAQYGVAKELPANSAATSIRFFRPRRANRSSVTQLVEGTAPSNKTEVAVGYVDCTLKQRGALSEITDVVRAVDLFDTLTLHTKTLAADAALDFDSVCSHAIVSSPGVADVDGTLANPIPLTQGTMYNSNGSFERFAGVPNTSNSANDFASLSGLSNSAARLTRAVALGAVTRLKGVLGTPAVPTIGGKYVCLVPPEVLQDMRQDQTWVNAAIYNNIKNIQLFPWAEFELDGVVYVEHNAPFIEKKAGTYGVFDTSGGVADSIYSLLYLGAEAFGVPKLSGMKAGSDPRAPSLIINDKPDKSDPLNQKTVTGWKAYYQAVLLKTNETTDQPHLVVQRVKSNFA